MNDSRPSAYAVVAEFQNQAPILMETEAPNATYEAARDRMEKLIAGRAVRACVVSLHYEHGNALVLSDLARS